jgi:hypothetical protein
MTNGPRKIGLTLAIVAVVAIARPARATTNFTDANWVGIGGLPGANELVYATAADSNGNVYFGGAFWSIGGASITNLAKWDGAAWSAVGGNSFTEGAIFCLLSDNSCNLYAGGSFTNAGGITASNVAKWNGTNWSSLGSGVSYSGLYGATVNAMAIDPAGNLYAGGWFTQAGSIIVNNVAKWDGTNWSALTSGMGGLGYVYCLACDSSGNLYAGGDFTTAGGRAANSVAKWNGAAWSALGSGVSGGTFFNPEVYSLALGNTGTLYVGGNFTIAGSVAAKFIAQWNGNTWSAVGSGMDAFVDCFAFDSYGSLYAGGGFTNAGEEIANSIAKWDGVGWSALGSGISGEFDQASAEVQTVTFDSFGNLYAGGVFTTAGTNMSDNIAEAVIGDSSYILSLAQDPSGTNVITVRVTPGASYALETATNLTPPVHWIPQMTNTAPGLNLLFTNVSAASQEFFRTRYISQ